MTTFRTPSPDLQKKIAQCDPDVRAYISCLEAEYSALSAEVQIRAADEANENHVSLLSDEELKHRIAKLVQHYGITAQEFAQIEQESRAEVDARIDHRNHDDSH